MSDIAPPLLGRQIGQGLIDALGLPKNTTGFTLRVYPNEIVTVACEYAPTDPSIVQLMGHFDVVHRNPAPSVGEPVHYDNWLRERTNRTHAEYMQRTSRHISSDWKTYSKDEIARFFNIAVDMVD